jgi:hypothetical protein
MEKEKRKSASAIEFQKRAKRFRQSQRTSTLQETEQESIPVEETEQESIRVEETEQESISVEETKQENIHVEDLAYRDLMFAFDKKTEENEKLTEEIENLKKQLRIFVSSTGILNR